MAHAGRQIRTSISTDRRVEQLSDQSALLFTWAFAHADTEGRLLGDPDAVRELVAPLRTWSSDDVAAFMAEWTQTTDEKSGLPRPLALIYIVDDGRVVIELPGWEKNQPMRLRRGARSSLPPPTDAVGQWANGPMGQWASGPPPAQLRARARGGGPKPREFSREEPTRQTTDRPVPDSLVWLSEEAHRVFGRPLKPPRPTKIGALVKALNNIGRDAAARRLREIASDGYDPESLGYFTPVFERAAVGVERESLGAGELIDLAARLEARGA